MEQKEVEKLLKVFVNESTEIVRQVTGGMMNVSYLARDKDGKEYIIYIPGLHANEMVDRELEKIHQRVVYALGITSKNIYFDIATGIKINEYIPGKSLDHEAIFNLEKIANLLKKLHGATVLSTEDYQPFERFENTYEKEALGFVKNHGPLYDQIRAFLFEHKNYLESQEKTLCHNDAQRSNIIKTPDDNYFLIDFEFMGNNDPIYDIATFGNGTVSEGRKLLDSYFKDELNEDHIKRYYLWRIFISLQWYNVAIAKHYRGEGEVQHYDFLSVANHFLMNAKSAFDGYKLEIREKGENDDIERLIISTLDKIRHFLRKDGGDCEFVSFNEGIVYVKMQGACNGCAYANSDIKELVEVILQEEVPGVLEVRLAD